MSDIVVYGGGGKGGGGSSRRPVEHPDNLRSTARARVLHLVSEGPIAANINDVLKSTYLDGTPVQNADGGMNFSDVIVDYRPGTQDQDYIQGFPASENAVGVGVELKQGQPWTQSFTNSQLSAVILNIGARSLVHTNSENMDRTGTTVAYRIQLQTNGGAFETVVSTSFSGKTTSGYERSHRINLPAGTSWSVRVIRDTPDSATDLLQNATYIGSYVEVIDAKLRYPNSALIGISISAEHFNGIPTCSWRLRGRLVRVPSNYDPEARTYAGVWDGTFKTAWSNNPAWVYLDMLTNDRYGVGRRLGLQHVDRYSLYQIARYCDEVVPDGFGGQEPRFTCNVYLQAASDAQRVLSDLASVFRGISYWASGMVRASADIPTDPVFTFTNANVKNGTFVRTSTGLRQRYSVAAVSYNDMDDFGRQKVEFVQDDAAVRRYGIRELQLTAFGCASRGQAHRVGKFALVTAQVESGGITFSVGLDSMQAQPGDIVRVLDQHRAGQRMGGRLLAGSTTTELVLDSASSINVGDSIFVADGSSVVQSVAGTVVAVNPALPVTPVAGDVWSAERAELKPELYRIVSIKEVTPLEFQIEAVQHEPSKFPAIDYGTRLENRPTTVVPPRVQGAPSSVTLEQVVTVEQGISRVSVEIKWDAPDNAVLYDVQWRRDSGDWVSLQRQSTRHARLDDVFAGTYIARVRAINALDVPSLWAYSEATELDGILGEPPAPVSLIASGIVFGVELKWGFPSAPNIIAKTEIRYGQTALFDDSVLLGEFSYPTNTHTLLGLSAGKELWFWARLIDKNGMAGPWFPAADKAGVRGQSSSDASDILDYLNGKISSGQLAPGLIEEIESGITVDIVGDIVGDLTGDDVDDATWFAGDDDDNFVGTVTTTSVINEGDYAEAKRTISLAASVDASLAVIRSVQQVQASDTQALAEEISTVAASIENIDFSELEAAIQHNTTAIANIDGSLSAQWGVKTQVRQDGRVVQSGVALGASIGKDGQARSEFLVMADTIAFLNTLNGKLHTPFVFDTVNDAAFLDTVFIKDGTITSAKVGNLQSTNYIAGQRGWRLDKNGNLEFNGAVAGGGRLSINNQLIRVYDANGTMRVRLGIW